MKLLTSTFHLAVVVVGHLASAASAPAPVLSNALLLPATNRYSNEIVHAARTTTTTSSSVVDAGSTSTSPVTTKALLTPEVRQEEDDHAPSSNNNKVVGWGKRNDKQDQVEESFMELAISAIIDGFLPSELTLKEKAFLEDAMMFAFNLANHGLSDYTAVSSHYVFNSQGTDNQDDGYYDDDGQYDDDNGGSYFDDDDQYYDDDGNGNVPQNNRKTSSSYLRRRGPSQRHKRNRKNHGRSSSRGKSHNSNNDGRGRNDFYSGFTCRSARCSRHRRFFFVSSSSSSPSEASTTTSLGDGTTTTDDFAPNTAIVKRWEDTLKKVLMGSRFDIFQNIQDLSIVETEDTNQDKKQAKQPPSLSSGTTDSVATTPLETSAVAKA